MVRDGLFLMVGGQSGVLLIEILTAVILLVFGFTMVLGMFGPMWRSFTGAKKMAVASSLAEGILEEIKLKPDCLNPGSYQSLVALGLLTQIPAGFSPEVEITVPAKHPEVWQIIVSINWMEKNRPRQVTVMNYLPRP